MDSLTHIAIGSAIGMSVMGSTVPRWRAALWGSVCATLPDLDTLIRHGDAIRAVTYHRAESHSLFYVTLVAPLIAWIISRLHGERTLFRRWWLLVWLVLFTHPLLDVMTIYGTQLGLPFTDYPFGLGSIFIIDPLFTLPVLIGAVVTLCWRNPRALKWTAGGMVVSALYLAWTFAAQQYVTRIAQAALQAQGIRVDRVEVSPTAFNTVLWRVLGVTPTHYVEGYYSLLDNDARIIFREHPRGAALYERFRSNWYVQRMAWFTHGFFKMQRQNGIVSITDLRLGMEPFYGFTFALFEEHAGRLVALPPERIGPPMSRSAEQAVAWLWRRLKGERLPPLQ